MSTRSPNSDGLSVDLLDAAVDLMGRSGRAATVRVRGRSMLPTLHEGQTLLVEFAVERRSRGDMLLFRQADYLVVHRLVSRSRFPDGAPYLRTRGDGMLFLDPPVAPERVVGRVTALLDGETWRSTRRPAGRAYARLLAWHDLFWTTVGVIARLGDRVLAKLRLPSPLTTLVTLCDRALLRLVHAVLFRAAHAAIPRPADLDAVRS